MAITARARLGQVQELCLSFPGEQQEAQVLGSSADAFKNSSAGSRAAGIRTGAPMMLVSFWDANVGGHCDPRTSTGLQLIG